MEEWEKAILGVGCYIGAVIVCNTAQMCHNGVREMIMEDAEKNKAFCFMRCLGSWAKCVGSIKGVCFKSTNRVHPEQNNQEVDIENQLSHQNSLPPEGYLHNMQLQYEGSQFAETLSVSQRIDRRSRQERIENQPDQPERVFSDNIMSVNNLIERGSNVDENAIGRLRLAQMQIRNNGGQIEANFRRPSSVRQQRNRIESVEELSVINI